MINVLCDKIIINIELISYTQLVRFLIHKKPSITK